MQGNKRGSTSAPDVVRRGARPGRPVRGVGDGGLDPRRARRSRPRAASAARSASRAGCGRPSGRDPAIAPPQLVGVGIDGTRARRVPPAWSFQQPGVVERRQQDQRLARRQRGAGARARSGCRPAASWLRDRRTSGVPRCRPPALAAEVAGPAGRRWRSRQLPRARRRAARGLPPRSAAGANSCAQPVVEILPVIFAHRSRRRSPRVTSLTRASSAARRSGVSNAPAFGLARPQHLGERTRARRAPRRSPRGRRSAADRRGPAPPAAARSAGSCRASAAAAPDRPRDRRRAGRRLSPSKHSIGSSAIFQSSAELILGQRGAERRDRRRDSRPSPWRSRRHSLRPRSAARRRARPAARPRCCRGSALVKERRLRRVEIFRRRRPSRSARPPKAMMRPRKSVIGNITRSRKRS